MIVLRRQRVGGLFGGGESTNWGNVMGGVTQAVGNWAIAREQRRAAQAGADPSTIGPGPGRFGAVGSPTGLAIFGIGIAALVLLTRR